MSKRQNINIIGFLPLFCAVLGTVLGVVGYFYLYPLSLALAGALVLVALLGYLCGRHKTSSLVWIGFVFIALGLFFAALRTEVVGTRFLASNLADKRYWVTGSVEEVSFKGKTARLLVHQPKVYGLTPEQTPQKIRISVQASRVRSLNNGDHVVAEVYLQRPNAAKFDGDFDYQRYAYYEGFGAVGQVRGDIYFEPPETPPATTWRSWREDLSADIYNSLGKTQSAAVLVALVTGQRDYVTEEIAENYRYSGLSHLMAISGFNLGAVGALLYLVTRLLWAAFPSLALRYNGKKPAALVGILGVLFYTLVAGANIPVFRAFIMISALFMAVWVERTRVALRLLALAAIIVAWLWPEGVLTASYQMSFMASLSLILWTYWHDNKYRTEHKLMQGITYAKAVWVTSLLAGLATMPFVVWHFQNLTLVGFLANLVAVPIMGLLTTPLAMLGFTLGVFIPWSTTLKPAAITIDWVNNLATTMAHWPMAQNFVPQQFTLVVLAIVLGLLTLIYLRRWLWLTGAGTVAIALLLWLNQHDFTPDVVSLDGGEIVLIKPTKGEVYLARTSKNEESKLLLKHYVEHRNWQITKTRPDAECDLEGCLYTIANHQVLVAEVGISPNVDDCREADVIVADPTVALPGCKETVWQRSRRVAEVFF